MRSSTSLLGRILMRIALQARIFGVAKTECVPWIINFCDFRVAYSVTRHSENRAFTMSSLLRNIYVTLKNVCSKLPWKYQGYHQEMEISGISNSYDYLL